MTTTFLKYILNPYYQPIPFLLTSLIIPVMLAQKSANSTWSIAGVAYLLYLIVNVIIIVFSGHTWVYFGISLLASISYLVIVGFLVPLIIKFKETPGSGESAMMFLSIIYHPFALLLVIFIKWIYQIIRIS